MEIHNGSPDMHHIHILSPGAYMKSQVLVEPVNVYDVIALMNLNLEPATGLSLQSVNPNAYPRVFPKPFKPTLTKNEEIVRKTMDMMVMIIMEDYDKTLKEQLYNNFNNLLLDRDVPVFKL